MEILGTTVTVTVDRPLGSLHPKCKSICYPLNYGYIKGILAGDGEEQDAYILGITKPVNEFTGRVIAVIHRLNDNEDKWVVAPEGMEYHQAEIMAAVQFQEQYFKTELICLFQKSCGVIVCRRKGEAFEYLLLFQHRSQTWSFPKGHAEVFETEMETALREAWEETGLTLKVRNGFRETITYPISCGAMKTVVLFLAETNGEIAMKQDEITEYIWADKDTALQYLNREGYRAILNKAEKCISGKA